ncbi:MAG: hypothetical protein KAX65_06105 [Caldilineaceae bacterium]|nr:hypothetical protein [Caldilineaceae bacterium]
MLIVYRTNTDFAGQIITLDRQQSLTEFDAWRIATRPTPEMAAIEVDEKLLHGELLATLAVDVATYRVVDGALTLDGVPVDLGYVPSTAGAAERMRSDPVMVALFDMDENGVRTWMATQTQSDINVLVWHALREMARVTKVAVR